MGYNLQTIAGQFCFDGRLKSIQAFGTGLINDTFCIACEKDNTDYRFVLQRINSHVFKNPEQVMENIVRVVEHIRSKLLEQNIADIDRKVLRVICTRDGENFYRDSNDNFWRAYSYIEKGLTYDKAPSAKIAYEAAVQFGLFAKMLMDLPAPALHETIPDFHNGPKRFGKFVQLLDADPKNRASETRPEIEFILKNEYVLNVLPELVDSGEIPIRPAHNDTKINNVVFDTETNDALCVIDLDTVMPGLTLFDFGDMVRTVTATADEDEPDASKMSMDMNLFTELARGFAKQTASFLTKAEKKYFAFSGQVITFEQAVRFLTDYLEGDVYYKTDCSSHNLDRTRTQIQLVKSIAVQRDDMEALVEKFLA